MKVWLDIDRFEKLVYLMDKTDNKNFIIWVMNGKKQEIVQDNKVMHYICHIYKKVIEDS